MTTPVPDEAVDWAAAVLIEELADAYDMGIEHNTEALRRIAARALAAASPTIRRDERERIWSLQVTQRLELHGGYPDGVWRCAGCLAELTGNRIAHLPKCSEMGLDRLAGGSE